MSKYSPKKELFVEENSLKQRNIRERENKRGENQRKDEDFYRLSTEPENGLQDRHCLK